MFCCQCGKRLPENAKFCPGCGAPIATDTSKNSDNISITLVMAKQSFLASAAVAASLNGIESAWVGDGQSVVLSVPSGKNEIVLKAGFRKRKITFSATRDVMINIKWNRLSGGLDVLCTGEDVQVL